MKKRGATKLHWDASYKEPKHLAKYHGEPVFHALVTATNEVLVLAQCMCGLLLCVCGHALQCERACVLMKYDVHSSAKSGCNFMSSRMATTRCALLSKRFWRP